MTPAAEGSSRGVAALWFFSAVVVLAAIPFAPRLAPFAPACPFRAWTGVPCLSCGGTRALVALAQGETLAAFASNPLVAAGVVAFVTGGLAAPVWLVFGGRLPALRSLPWPARIAAGLLLAASWLWVVLSQ